MTTVYEVRHAIHKVDVHDLEPPDYWDDALRPGVLFSTFEKAKAYVLEAYKDEFKYLKEAYGEDEENLWPEKAPPVEWETFDNPCPTGTMGFKSEHIDQIWVIMPMEVEA